MKFTDEDVKRLKDFLSHDCTKCDGHEDMPFNGNPFDKTKALLHRLECAEKVASMVDILHKETKCDGGCSIVLIRDEWHKSCGR